MCLKKVCTYSLCALFYIGRLVAYIYIAISLYIHALQPNDLCACLSLYDSLFLVFIICSYVCMCSKGKEGVFVWVCAYLFGKNIGMCFAYYNFISVLHIYFFQIYEAYIAQILYQLSMNVNILLNLFIFLFIWTYHMYLTKVYLYRNLNHEEEFSFFSFFFCLFLNCFYAFYPP